jgi:hypothetical protein
MTRIAANLLAFRADVDPTDTPKPRRTRRMTPGANKGGRPRKYPEGSRGEMKLYLSNSLVAALNKMAEEQGVTRNALVGQILVCAVAYKDAPGYTVRDLLAGVAGHE